MDREFDNDGINAVLRIWERDKARAVKIFADLGITCSTDEHGSIVMPMADWERAMDAVQQADIIWTYTGTQA